MALLVHGLVNAAMAREDMGASFAFNHPHDHGGTGAAYWCVVWGWGGPRGRPAVGGLGLADVSAPIHNPSFIPCDGRVDEASAEGEGMLMAIGDRVAFRVLR